MDTSLEEPVPVRVPRLIPDGLRPLKSSAKDSDALEVLEVLVDDSSATSKRSSLL